MRYLIAADIFGTKKRVYLPEIHYSESSAKGEIKRLKTNSMYSNLCVIEYPEKSRNIDMLECEINRLHDDYCPTDIVEKAINLVDENDVPFEKKVILDLMAEYLENNGYFVAKVETQKRLSELQTLIEQ